VKTPPPINPIATPAEFLFAYVVARAGAIHDRMDGRYNALQAVEALEVILEEVDRIYKVKP
jgi:hypothetical protein